MWVLLLALAAGEVCESEVSLLTLHSQAARQPEGSPADLSPTSDPSAQAIPASLAFSENTTPPSTTAEPSADVVSPASTTAEPATPLMSTPAEPPATPLVSAPAEPPTADATPPTPPAQPYSPWSRDEAPARPPAPRDSAIRARAKQHPHVGGTPISLRPPPTLGFPKDNPKGTLKNELADEYARGKQNAAPDGAETQDIIAAMKKLGRMIKRMPDDRSDMPSLRDRDLLTVHHAGGPTPEPYTHARALRPFGKGVETTTAADLPAVKAADSPLRRTLHPDEPAVEPFEEAHHR